MEGWVTGYPLLNPLQTVSWFFVWILCLVAFCAISDIFRRWRKQRGRGHARLALLCATVA
jgi:formate hydrogenlyase subunit 3/multisubunit Na+/H+ antiporter MnhD subunit